MPHSDARGTHRHAPKTKENRKQNNGKAITIKWYCPTSPLQGQVKQSPGRKFAHTRTHKYTHNRVERKLQRSWVRGGISINTHKPPMSTPGSPSKLMLYMTPA